MIFDSPHRRLSPWCAALLGAAVLILMPTFLPDAHAQERLDPQTVEHALACSDHEKHGVRKHARSTGLCLRSTGSGLAFCLHHD